jgi:dihydroxyacetone kinase-like protein
MDVEHARSWVRAIADAVDAGKDHLTELDAAIGDGDHGTNLQRGFTAAVVALDAAEFPVVGDVLIATGSALISKVGGASGPLYGSAFRAMGWALPLPTATPAELLAALVAGLDGLRRLGGAAPGDKTIVDAYSPAIAAFEGALNAGGTLGTASAAAAEAAADGARATAGLQARKGRASYLGARSLGHQDPGATLDSAHVPGAGRRVRLTLRPANYAVSLAAPLLRVMVVLEVWRDAATMAAMTLAPLRSAFPVRRGA